MNTLLAKETDELRIQKLKRNVQLVAQVVQMTGKSAEQLFFFQAKALASGEDVLEEHVRAAHQYFEIHRFISVEMETWLYEVLAGQREVI